MNTLRTLLIGALCLSWAVTMAADAPAAPSPLQAQLTRIRDLQKQRPNDSLLLYYEALTLAQLGEAKPAVDALRALLGRRSGIVPVDNLGFGRLEADPEYRKVRQQLWDEEPRTPDSPAVFRLADPRLIPEGIAYDAKRRMHYLGSIAQRKVIAVDRRGQPRDVSSAQDKLDAVLGLAVDARNERLCAVSTNGFELAGEKNPRNAIVCWSLDKGRRLMRVEVPSAKQLNDLAFAPDGTMFVTDSAEGSLWRMRPGERQLQRFGAAGALRGANGVAVSADGSSVYATLSTGIARVDLATGEGARMPQPDELVTGGIDGLYWHDGDLVGVQNSPNPGRVIRIRLAEGGRRIDGLTVLQSHHHPEFVEPTTGVVVGDRLHVIANSHVMSFQPDGSLQGAESLRPTVVVSVPLRR